jgi:hypothetical protein
VYSESLDHISGHSSECASYRKSATCQPPGPQHLASGLRSQGKWVEQTPRAVKGILWVPISPLLCSRPLRGNRVICLRPPGPTRAHGTWGEMRRRSGTGKRKIEEPK